MKKLNLILAFILTSVAVSCEEFTHPCTEWVEYIVYPEAVSGHWLWKSNGHRAIPGYYGTQIRGNTLEFDFQFPDSSCIYDIDEDQSDWNKLYGITDFLDNIPTHSFRFSDRWFDDELQIGCYVHLGGDTLKAYIYPADIGEIVKGIIEISKGEVIFKLITEYGNFEEIIKDDRIKTSDTWWVLPRYFGGNRTASHPMKVNIKCKQLITALDN